MVLCVPACSNRKLFCTGQTHVLKGGGAKPGASCCVVWLPLLWRRVDGACGVALSGGVGWVQLLWHVHTQGSIRPRLVSDKAWRVPKCVPKERHSPLARLYCCVCCRSDVAALRGSVCVCTYVEARRCVVCVYPCGCRLLLLTAAQHRCCAHCTVPHCRLCVCPMSPPLMCGCSLGKAWLTHSGFWRGV